MQRAVGPSTTAGEALLLRQLRNTMHAMHGMYKATGQLREAERIRIAAQEKLGSVKATLERTGQLHTPPSAVAVAERPVPVSRWAQAAAQGTGAAPVVLSEEQRQLEQIKHLAAVSRPPERQKQSPSGQPPAAEPAAPVDKSRDKGRGL